MSITICIDEVIAILKLLLIRCFKVISHERSKKDCAVGLLSVFVIAELL